MGDARPPSAPQALEAIAQIRASVADLPEIAEIVDGHGHHTFKVRDKSFVIIGQGKGEGSLSIKSDPETQRFLIQHRGFVRTPYTGQHGWVSVPGLPPKDWDEVGALARDAYRLAAPASLRKKSGDPW